jgi:hypothetical protein
MLALHAGGALPGLSQGHGERSDSLSRADDKGVVLLRSDHKLGSRMGSPPANAGELGTDAPATRLSQQPSQSGDEQQSESDCH